MTLDREVLTVGKLKELALNLEQQIGLEGKIYFQDRADGRIFNINQFHVSDDLSKVYLSERDK